MTIPSIEEAISEGLVRIEDAKERLARGQVDPMSFADSLKSVHNAVLAAHAHALLSEAFPRHSTAIFVRNWDEDSPHLLQLLSGDAAVPDYDTTEQDGRPDWISPEQWSALVEAERAIAYLGTDEEVHEHLEPGEDPDSHPDWVEFQMALRG